VLAIGVGTRNDRADRQLAVQVHVERGWTVPELPGSLEGWPVRRISSDRFVAF
jgi:hypothetical protein